MSAYGVDLTFSVLSASDSDVVVKLSGFINAETAPLLRDSLSGIIAEHPTKVIICNFEDIEFMSSTGVGVFRQFVDLCNVKFAFVHLNYVARRPLEALGFLPIFGNYPDVSKAREQMVSKS